MASFKEGVSKFTKCITFLLYLDDVMGAFKKKGVRHIGLLFAEVWCE